MVLSLFTNHPGPPAPVPPVGVFRVGDLSFRFDQTENDLESVNNDKNSRKKYSNKNKTF